MRILLQRVLEAKIVIGTNEYAAIKKGLLLFIGIGREDTSEDLEWLVTKTLNMRIFSDSKDQMNYSVQDIQGELLVVSQFTLFASTKKGNRPGFSMAAPPEEAKNLYQQFVNKLEENSGKKIKTGIFGEDMKVYLVNDGPVTVFIDTKNKE